LHQEAAWRFSISSLVTM